MGWNRRALFVQSPALHVLEVFFLFDLGFGEVAGGLLGFHLHRRVGGDKLGRDFDALRLDEWRRYDAAFEDGILAVITPEAAVGARLTPQSTNPAAVARALAETRAWVTARTSGS